MEKESSTALCRVLYEYIKKIGRRRDHWIKKTRIKGVNSFNSRSTMDICSDILRLIDKTAYSYYVENNIRQAFATLGDDFEILKAYFELGQEGLSPFPSPRTGYRRIQKYSEKVIRNCETDVIKTAVREADESIREFYRMYSNKMYRV